MVVRSLLPLAVMAATCCATLVADEPATVLVYEAEQPEAAGSNARGVDIPKLVEAIRKRLRTGHVKGRRVRARDDNRIEVTIHGTDPKTVERVVRLIESPGTLEFRILANRRDHRGLIDRAEKAGGPAVRDEKGNRLTWWVPVTAKAESAFDKDKDIATRKRKQGDRESLEVLVVKDPFDVGGRYLSSVSPSVDSRGKPCVDFTFDARGGKLFGRLTGDNLPDAATGFARKLGVILDGRLHAAPAIQGTIRQRGVITGRFTKQEVDDLVAVLNAGSLPARIKEVGRSTVNLKR